MITEDAGKVCLLLPDPIHRASSFPFAQHYRVVLARVPLALSQGDILFLMDRNAKFLKKLLCPVGWSKNSLNFVLLSNPLNDSSRLWPDWFLTAVEEACPE